MLVAEALVGGPQVGETCQVFDIIALNVVGNLQGYRAIDGSQQVQHRAGAGPGEDVGHVVTDPAAIGESGNVAAKDAQGIGVIGGSNVVVQAQQVGGHRTAVPLSVLVAREAQSARRDTLEQDQFQVGPAVYRRTPGNAVQDRYYRCRALGTSGIDDESGDIPAIVFRIGGVEEVLRMGARVPGVML